MTESQRSLLLQLAAEMIHGKGMPPEWVGDWENVGKGTPMKTKREMSKVGREANEQCRAWARRIKAVLDGR